MLSSLRLLLAIAGFSVISTVPSFCPANNDESLTLLSRAMSSTKYERLLIKCYHCITGKRKYGDGTGGNQKGMISLLSIASRALHRDACVDLTHGGGAYFSDFVHNNSKVSLFRCPAAMSIGRRRYAVCSYIV